MRQLLLVVAIASVTACSLPLSHDVRTVTAVQPQRRQQGDLQVLPPGPKAGATPEEVVEGFLGAEANSERRHAIAREFLTANEATSWRDDSEVQVYDPDRPLQVQQVGSTGAGAAAVDVSSFVSGSVGADGAYVSQVASAVRERYQLQRVKGEWRLSDVPDGLRLTSADRERAYQPQSIYYLASAVGDTPEHLVPDQVFLPVGNDLATTLVRRLLERPSAALGDSVTSAFPAVMRLRSVTMSGSGVVTVDLQASLVGQPAALLQAMSAQLVWTLRGLGPSFTGLRLQQDGVDVAVPTEGRVQDAQDWNSFDPDGLGPNPPYFFVAGRRLRSDLTLPSGPATAGDPGLGGSFGVDAVAVTPDRTQFALLEGAPPGVVTIRTGPLRGPFLVGPSARGLSSPTWGSGQFGLWMLRDDHVVLLPNGGRQLQGITVLGQPSGRVEALAMSRDGARAALVVAGQLYVGRVTVVGSSPRVVGLTQVLPSATHVTKVAWSSGTELVVLGSLSRNQQVLRVAVDGSSVTALNVGNLVPSSVTASSAGVLIGAGTGVFRYSGRGFAHIQAGSWPVYPG